MSDEPRDPVQASDALDVVIEREFSALRSLLRRQRFLTQLSFVALALVAALAMFGAGVAVRVDNNTREIDRTQDALRVFCDQTNRNNREARARFLEQFADIAPDPKQLIQFADVNWPQRDCEQVSTVSDPSTSSLGSMP